MKKRPSDPFQLAKLIGDIATGQSPDKEKQESPKSPKPKKPQNKKSNKKK